jgi:Flp pilus assembly protein TadB
MSDGSVRFRYAMFGLALVMWAVLQTTISAVVFAITGVALAVAVFQRRSTRREDER